MIIMALFVIVVISFLAGALIKIVSASSNSTVHQVYGLRAQLAAQAGIQNLLQASFAVDGTASACNASISAPSGFSNVIGFSGCEYQARCVTETINFANVERLYFKYNSEGICTINNHVVSRSVSVDAIQEVDP